MALELVARLQPYLIAILVVVTILCAPGPGMAISSVLFFGSNITLYMREVFLSHGVRLRLPRILRKGLCLFPGAGVGSFDLAKDLSVVINEGRFLISFTGLGDPIFELLMVPPSKREGFNSGCFQDPPNADIVGLGVRYSIYILLSCLFISLFVASFHRQQSGTKELGCMILISK
jgi:hypothetical protein